MKKYKQLTVEQRYQIEALLQVGISQAYIASQLGVHRSTICRELKRGIALRGKTAGVYLASNAERKKKNRHKHKNKKVKLTAELKRSIHDKMCRDKWSSELISKKWKQHNIPVVSHVMMGKDHKSALLVLTDRTTLITMIEKLKGKSANEVTSKIKERLSRFSSSYFKSIFYDSLYITRKRNGRK